MLFRRPSATRRTVATSSPTLPQSSRLYRTVSTAFLILSAKSIIACTMLTGLAMRLLELSISCTVVACVLSVCCLINYYEPKVLPIVEL